MSGDIPRGYWQLHVRWLVLISMHQSWCCYLGVWRGVILFRTIKNVANANIVPKNLFFYFLIISPPLWIDFIPKGCVPIHEDDRWVIWQAWEHLPIVWMATEASQSCAGKQANSRYKYLRPNGLVSRCKVWHFACCLVTVLSWRGVNTLIEVKQALIYGLLATCANSVWPVLGSCWTNVFGCQVWLAFPIMWKCEKRRVSVSRFR